MDLITVLVDYRWVTESALPSHEGLIALIVELRAESAEAGAENAALRAGLRDAVPGTCGTPRGHALQDMNPGLYPPATRRVSAGHFRPRLAA